MEYIFAAPVVENTLGVSLESLLYLVLSTFQMEYGNCCATDASIGQSTSFITSHFV